MPEIFDRPSRDEVRELDADTGALTTRAATAAEKRAYDDLVAEFKRVDEAGVVRITEGG